MEKSTYYFPTALQHRLRQAAKREDRSQAAIVRDAVERYLVDDPDLLEGLIGAFDGPGDGADGTAIKDDLRARWKKDLARPQKRKG